MYLNIQLILRKLIFTVITDYNRRKCNSNATFQTVDISVFHFQGTPWYILLQKIKEKNKEMNKKGPTNLKTYAGYYIKKS